MAILGRRNTCDLRGSASYLRNGNEPTTPGECRRAAARKGMWLRLIAMMDRMGTKSVGVFESYGANDFGIGYDR